MKNQDVELSFSNFDEDEAMFVYQNYKQAMCKRRPGSELEFDRFWSYIDNTQFFNYKNTFVFGQVENDCFIPTHFAPGGLREGIEAIKALKNCNNVIFVVTDDLVKMLKKLGYGKMPFTVKKDFRGETVEKHICFSSFSAVGRYVSTGIKENISKVFSNCKVVKIYKKAKHFIYWKIKCIVSPSSIIDEDELYK